MGGCCSSSKKVQLQGAPVYYYCQPTLEEQRTFHSYNGSASTLAAGFFVGLNLDSSIPDTYQPPPAPIPFSVLFGRPHSPVVTFGSHGGKLDAADRSKQGFENSASKHDVNMSDSKNCTESETEDLKTNFQNSFSNEDEDCCPICFEEYDAENPKWITNCKHDYHFSCILEWIERSDSCPVCNKEMTFGHTDKLKKILSHTSSLYPNGVPL